MMHLTFIAVFWMRMLVPTSVYTALFSDSLSCHHVGVTPAMESVSQPPHFKENCLPIWWMLSLEYSKKHPAKKMD
jgi:hypothetical protein